MIANMGHTPNKNGIPCHFLWFMFCICVSYLYIYIYIVSQFNLRQAPRLGLPTEGTERVRAHMLKLKWQLEDVENKCIVLKIKSTFLKNWTWHAMFWNTTSRFWKWNTTFLKLKSNSLKLNWNTLNCFWSTKNENPLSWKQNQLS